MLENHGMTQAHESKIPMEPGIIKLVPAPPDYKANHDILKKYQSLIGSLMYAILGNRPDIAFAVSMVSRFASNPTDEHMEAAKKILRYLRGTINYELTYRGDLKDLLDYSDADYSGDRDTRKSTGSFVFNVGSATISWSSKRQPTITLSSCKSELIAETQASKEAI